MDRLETMIPSTLASSCSKDRSSSFCSMLLLVVVVGVGGSTTISGVSVEAVVSVVVSASEVVEAGVSA